MKWHIDKTKLFLHNVLALKRAAHTEYYCLNGRLHNPNGPAYRSWYENGQLACEQYVLNGRLHNPNGPAYRSWYDNGQLWCEHYYLNGERLTKEQFLARLNK